jgi:16S rRNA (adenine1518-N6/adenine1519-N6)-dimethyltransferase
MARVDQQKIPHKARKRFGQNFLHDNNIIDKIVRSVHAKAGDHLIEIGPGKGAITAGLVASGAKIDVVEIDRDLIPWLKLQFGLKNNFSITSADALTIDFAAMRTTDSKLRIIGNLPYNISTPLLFHLMTYRDHIDDMYFMLQKEVVDRMSATPGNKAWGKLGVMLQYHCDIQPLFAVAPSCFNPPPKIDSAVVRLKVRTQPTIVADDFPLFENIVSIAFQQRRKTLRNSLKKIITDEQLTKAQIDSKLRPEQLSVADYVRLSNNVTAESKS